MSPLSRTARQRSIDRPGISDTSPHDGQTSSADASQVQVDADELPPTVAIQMASRLERASNNLPQLTLIKTASLPEESASGETSSPVVAASLGRRKKSSPSDLMKQSSFGDLSESTMATLAIANSPSLGALSRSVENLDELPESETPGYEITSSEPSTTFDPTTILER